MCVGVCVGVSVCVHGCVWVGGCVCMDVCVCVSGCVHGCVWVGVCMGARARACACARVALLVQHATRRHIVIFGLSDSTICFDINKRYDFRKKIIEHKMYAFTFPATFT